MIYDVSVDELVINELKSRKMHFNELLEEINKKRSVLRKKSITPKTLNAHLILMSEQHKINRDPAQHVGIRRYCWLTEETKLQLKLGIFENVQTLRQNRINTKLTKEQELKRMFIILITMAASGATRAVVSFKPEAGDIDYQDPSTGRIESYKAYSLQGASIEDVSKPHFLDPRFKLSSQRFSEEEVENCIKTLTALRPQIIVPTLDPKEESIFRYLNRFTKSDTLRSKSKLELRYRIFDDSLKNFFMDSYNLLQDVIRRMEATWTFIRKPKRAEIQWYRQLVGLKATTEFFSKEVCEKRARFAKYVTSLVHFYSKDNQMSRIEKENTFERIMKEDFDYETGILDKMIENQMKLISTKYGAVKNDYKTFFDLIMDLAYPKFMTQIKGTSTINKRHLSSFRNI